MANNLKSFVEVKGNVKVVKLIDSLINKVNGNESDSPITAFATAFYDDVDLTEDRGVLNTWSYDKLGSKWTTLYDVIDQGAFSIESAWYPPKKFFIHLYNLCFPLDNEVVIEVKYEDETFDPVGALVIKTLTHEGDEGEVSEGRLWVEETEMEDPTVDMDWDHEDYDQTQMEFYESVAETQDNLLSQCMEMVETDGLSFEDVD
jgi:hypothetical protein